MCISVSIYIFPSHFETWDLIIHTYIRSSGCSPLTSFLRWPFPLDFVNSNQIQDSPSSRKEGKETPYNFSLHHKSQTHTFILYILYVIGSHQHSLLSLLELHHHTTTLLLFLLLFSLVMFAYSDFPQSGFHIFHGYCIRRMLSSPIVVCIFMQLWVLYVNCLFYLISLGKRKCFSSFLLSILFHNFCHWVHVIRYFFMIMYY